MKIIYGLFFAFILGVAMPAHATSLQDFRAKSPEAQGKFVADYVDKIANDLSAKNPKFGRAIVEYFAVTPTGKQAPDGLVDLTVQEMTVDALAKQGKADKSKIQIEAMIIYVVKQKFSIQTAQR